MRRGKKAEEKGFSTRRKANNQIGINLGRVSGERNCSFFFAKLLKKGKKGTKIAIGAADGLERKLKLNKTK